jgi:hypothetical protein
MIDDVALDPRPHGCSFLLIHPARAGVPWSEGLPPQNSEFVDDRVESRGADPVVGPVGVAAGFDQPRLFHHFEMV